MVLRIENNLNVNTHVVGNLNIQNNINVRKNINVEGNLILCGDLSVNKYINFDGNLSKDDGYGFRNNSGTLQSKNNGGTWANIAVELWTLRTEGATTETYFNQGNVGIGTNNPNDTLDIYGNLSVSENSNIFGNMNVTHNLNVAGDGIISKNFNVYKNLNISGNTNITSNLSVSNYGNFAGNISIATIGNLKNQSLIINHPMGSNNNKSFIDFQYNGTQIGSIEQSTTSSVVYNTTSDYRLKRNIKNVKTMLDKIDNIRVVEFNYVKDKIENKNIGFIAHELQDIFPENLLVTGEKDSVAKYCNYCGENRDIGVSFCCSGEEEGKDYTVKPKYQLIDYSKMTPICIKGIQELREENNILKQNIIELKNDNNMLEFRVSKLENLIININNKNNM